MKLWPNYGEKHGKQKGRPEGRPLRLNDLIDRNYMQRAARTVTARRFCDQQEMSSQVATGRSLP